MEKEHKMCDWCGNEYGKKYSWLRLIVAILIGLFIFSAGYHLGELNVLVHSQYAMPLVHGEWHTERIMRDQDSAGTTTIVVPSTTAPAAQ